MTSIDLFTSYLGLKLANPFMTGASPLGDHLDTVRRLEDAGCAAIVLHSLFQEQISQEDTGRIHHMDPLDRQFTAVLSYYPEPDSYASRFSGKYKHQTLTGGIGHNLPQEAPAAFAQAVIDVSRL